MMKLKGWRMAAFVVAVPLALLGSGYGLWQLYKSWKTQTPASS
jgi:uncharacterized membrane protein YqjE